jgi:hypothetical protein
VDGEVLAPSIRKNTWRRKTLAVTFIKFIVFFELRFEDRCAWDSSYKVSLIRCSEEIVTSRFEFSFNLRV